MTSLYAVTQLVDMGEPLPGSFDKEVERLADVARRVALLQGDMEASPTPISLSDVLERANGLHGGLKDLTQSEVNVDLDDAGHAVLVNEARALRLVLLFYDLASRYGDAGSVTLQVAGDERGAEVSFIVPPDAPMSALKPLDRVAGLEGGRVDFEAGRCTLHLPSLALARERGR